MKSLGFNRCALTCVVFLMLAGCGTSQPPIGAPARPAVYRALPQSSAYRVLHRFGPFRKTTRDHGGANPIGGLLDVDGVLYGTTNAGGSGWGTVYSITTTGKKKTLYGFGYSDGVFPGGGLISVNGLLYGTTSNGGACGFGTVYSVSKTGTETVLHSFCGTDGMYPPAGALVNVKGTLYGTTFQGGTQSSSGWGTVYSITTGAAFKVLHTFLTCDKTDPCGLNTGLVYVKGTFYGTSIYGGTGCPDNGGCGTVFSVSKTGKAKLLYSFQAGKDGWFPESALINVNGTLYGTTLLGGDHYGCDRSGSCGTIYSISTSGSEKVLYSFVGGSDGSNPDTNLLAINGTLYGTTVEGGAANDGTVFTFTTSGGGEQVIHAFGGSDGANPLGYLIDVQGTLYGTTQNGGFNSACYGKGCGVAFALTP